jgi:hypothetical protein
MRIINEYDFRNAKQIIDLNKSIMKDILSAFNSCPYKLGSDSPSKVKEYVGEILNSKGWADKVKIDSRLRLSINYVKDDYGVALQLGNVARVYADLFKLSYLEHVKIIKAGILIVPCQYESKLMGGNYACYEKTVSELEVMHSVVRMPLLILGIGNAEVA